MTDKKPHHIGTLSPEMALLGLLYKEAGHGYDLHRTVNADLDQVWHLSQSQAYAILKRLEARGDVSTKKIAQEKLPSRRLSGISGAQIESGYQFHYYAGCSYVGNAAGISTCSLEIQIKSMAGVNP